MRAGFELTLERMDKKIQENELEHKRRLKPWQELVEKREGEVTILKARIEELKEEELVTRKQEAEVLAEVRKELEVAKKAEELARLETLKWKSEAASLEEGMKKDTSARKIMLLQMKLDEVTKQCEKAVRSKDRELKQKTDIITSLQQRVLEEVKNREADDEEWDRRVQKKEEGYGIVSANLAFAEGQILEERKRTQEALEVIRRRERTIEQLKLEHTEELRIRLVDHEALEVRIRELEREVDESDSRFDAERVFIRREYECKYEAIRRRYEDEVADLRLEMDKRDRQRELVEQELEALRVEFEKARNDWEDKKREMEVMIGFRDRQIVALKNEIEFINDSWEVKYNRLMGLFERLQKKYEESIGPNGPHEAYRRARDLKIENNALCKEIMELKEMIQKQRTEIRDLRTELHITIEECAMTIEQKERGIAEMVGDMAKLESRLRAEIELKERLVKEMTAEKFAIVSSFEGRIRQLEQQVEAMRFTDRQELVDTIDIWKRAYERACIERDELEDSYKELVDVKDKQVQKMAIEYAEVQDRVQEEIIKGQQALEECEAVWKKLEAKWGVERWELEKEIQRLIQERDQARRERDKEKGVALAKDRPDPELDILRRKVAEKEEQIKQVESGVQKLIEENTRLAEEQVVQQEKMEEAKADWEPQIRWRDERYEAMVREHEAIKEILQLEMLKARETCKLIEAQVKRFPSPFEQELKEAEDKYAQSQAGLMKLSQTNVHLKQEILDLQEEKAKDAALFEEQLALAASILKEVATLGALKSLSKAAIGQLEEALGVDLDGDARIG